MYPDELRSRGAASPRLWLRFVGVPENAEQLGSLVSGVSSVIQRGARRGDHGRFPDEDLHGEVIGAVADDHALQVVAFPRGLDDQRSTRLQKPIAILTVALESDRRFDGWPDVSKSDAFAE